ncbi:hypothetical protein I7I48_11330 [Histoplasma ohiense]|nr:hypothetical protein I7I48_11330 [Histoplasma ohiense (nom. inval.)]
MGVHFSFLKLTGHIREKKKKKKKKKLPYFLSSRQKRHG